MLESQGFAVDPIAAQYPELTPYQVASLSPIYMRELEGLEGILSTNVGIDFRAQLKVSFTIGGRDGYSTSGSASVGMNVRTPMIGGHLNASINMYHNGLGTSKLGGRTHSDLILTSAMTVGGGNGVETQIKSTHVNSSYSITSQYASSLTVGMNKVIHLTDFGNSPRDQTIGFFDAKVGGTKFAVTAGHANDFLTSLGGDGGDDGWGASSMISYTNSSGFSLTAGFNIFNGERVMGVFDRTEEIAKTIKGTSYKVRYVRQDETQKSLNNGNMFIKAAFPRGQGQSFSAQFGFTGGKATFPQMIMHYKAEIEGADGEKRGMDQFSHDGKLVPYVGAGVESDFGN
ncbi:hypothetical protein SapgrDRAFT_0030 [Saprospira grandis DSM 2844]|uniref:Uncharacterized protein n=1 Tax=Saprospira grandis DSM 2844 TaxID=694433 RepID=J1I0K6_9BACT|nr:hypothetical protein [Saprospira grandis]EJF51793.1 hypothetical protein SapgrDRAFT_0030 [Saprospira grandis DSM 2844]